MSRFDVEQSRNPPTLTYFEWRRDTGSVSSTSAPTMAGSRDVSTRRTTCLCAWRRRATSDRASVTEEEVVGVLEVFRGRRPLRFRYPSRMPTRLPRPQGGLAMTVRGESSPHPQAGGPPRESRPSASVWHWIPPESCLHRYPTTFRRAYFAMIFFTPRPVNMISRRNESPNPSDFRIFPRPNVGCSTSRPVRMISSPSYS